MTYGLHRSCRVGAIALSGAAVIALGTPAMAEDDPPPGYVEPVPPEIDPESAGLMLGDGATLADPRVLDIKFITEDLASGETGETGETGEEDPTTGGGTGGETGGAEDGQAPAGGGEQREERTGGTHKFTLQTDVLFAEGSAELGDEAQTALQDVAAAIDASGPAEVNIFGFTDDQGSYESGRVLSDERAWNTQDALLDLIENPTEIQFNVRGYSEDYPLYDNTTEEGRQGNRRVEISWPTEE
ncbi:OmpA family protein [Streptomyces johnsoniae]|uniref:OmpA family protein n=1 Tax=Streptomyces johnsoniae TaxID=3075532 RepID=A0ABU2S1V3_9ACTN|nr:OmpA family protein [Streptomyces sp. DSM 41886]MDT0442978.1 OmpA family protein [Streptomyces sp. DSM 41886]